MFKFEVELVVDIWGNKIFELFLVVGFGDMKRHLHSPLNMVSVANTIHFLLAVVLVRVLENLGVAFDMLSQ